MTVTKESYAKNKVDNIGSKRKKPQVTPKGDVEIGFTDDGIVHKNRAYRRRNLGNNLYTRKGFIEYLRAIRIVRKKNGKSSIKYVKLDKSVI